MPLSDVQIRNAKPTDKPRKLADTGGLYLVVTPQGGKLWRMDCRHAGKRLTLSFGKWPTIGLSAARGMRDTARGKIAEGVDPRIDKRTGEPVRSPAGATFKEVANRWLESNRIEWSVGHLRRTENGLYKDLYPEIGDKPIAEIEAPDVLAAIRKVEARGVRDTAHRVRATASQIFKFAIAEGSAKRDPAGDINAALAKRPTVKHRSAFTREELPELIRRLRAEMIEPITRDALWLTLLTAVRTGETRFAHVDEFRDLEGPEPLWRIPGSRMKMQRDHLVPLSRQAAEIVKRRYVAAPASGLLFGKDTRSGVISENGMLYCLYRMGYHSRVTVHGFRGSFSTIANEEGWNRDWIEMQLAHVDGDVRGMYNAAEYLPGRRELLQWWADLVMG